MLRRLEFVTVALVEVGEETWVCYCSIGSSMLRKLGFVTVALVEVCEETWVCYCSIG